MAKLQGGFPGIAECQQVIRGVAMAGGIGGHRHREGADFLALGFPRRILGLKGAVRLGELIAPPHRRSCHNRPVTHGMGREEGGKARLNLHGARLACFRDSIGQVDFPGF